MTWIVRMAIAAAINVLALIVADWVFDGLAVGRWGSIILAGIVLGLANVFLKPHVSSGFVASSAPVTVPSPRSTTSCMKRLKKTA